MGLLDKIGVIGIVMILGSIAAVVAMIKEILYLRKKDRERQKGENMEEWDTSAMICGNCMWWDRAGWCCLEPTKVPKMYDDFCSHWTAKQLNEVKPLNEVKT